MKINVSLVIASSNDTHKDETPQIEQIKNSMEEDVIFAMYDSLLSKFYHMIPDNSSYIAHTSYLQKQLPISGTICPINACFYECIHI